MREEDAGRSGPTNLLELQGSVRKALEGSGALDKLRSRLRTEIFHAIQPEKDVNGPPPPREALALNSLIMEYLRYHHFDNTLSVFEAEVGPTGKAAIERRVIEDDLGIQDDDQDVPLLYGMMTVLKGQKQRRQQQAAAEAALERRMAQHRQQEEGGWTETAARPALDDAGGSSAAPVQFSS